MVIKMMTRLKKKQTIFIQPTLLIKCSLTEISPRNGMPKDQPYNHLINSSFLFGELKGMLIKIKKSMPANYALDVDNSRIAKIMAELGISKEELITK